VLRCGEVPGGGQRPVRHDRRELAQGRPYTINADADVDEALQLMEQHRIRRLPVIENRRLVGIISEADVGRHLPEDKVGHFVEMVCAQR
jgi:CBS domain-containing protein